MKLNTLGCSGRKNFRCNLCKTDREEGCNNPTKCRKNAVKKLDNLLTEWDPRLSAPAEERDDNLPPLDESYVRVKKAYPPPRRPSDTIRVFTNLHEGATGANLILRSEGDNIQTTSEDVEVYTDGSCHNNGTENALCGSGLWYRDGDPRNLNVRIGSLLPRTNNTGELVAVLKAIQAHKNTARLCIISDSQYTIQAITKRAATWLETGFEGVQNKQIVRAKGYHWGGHESEVQNIPEESQRT